MLATAAAASIPTWSLVATVLAAIFGSGGICVFITKYWEHQRRKREQTDNVLLTQLRAQGQQIKGMRREARMERLLCDARLAVQRHKFNNLDGAFEGVLMLFKTAPEKVADMIPDIIAQRQADREREAVESAAVMQAALDAAVKAAQLDDDEDGDTA